MSYAITSTVEDQDLVRSILAGLVLLCGAVFSVVQLWKFIGRARSISTRAAGPQTIKLATNALDALAAIVPSRIANEEIGDALEFMLRMKKAKRPKSLIYAKVATTYAYVLVHTGLHYAERIAGIIGKATGGKGD
ncbi:hypothetical protein [Pyxidicoccus caerfyrddinensis]|uniref:hypothetical protein n=1 Tax=Pyxidicoccus caerfyrddinensis TaxID=2709663 RepID=UPI0013DAE1C2|nr:hypothetical protein [Pyxidicoccus caerfyrddinensis]